MSEHLEKSEQSDEDDNMKYIESHLEPVKGEKMENTSLKKFLEEDEQSRYFMSEPSISSQGDLDDSFHPSDLLSPPGSLSDASSNHLLPPPPPPQQPTVMSSPGNTSISSRDNSPRMNQHKVQMQFMQDKRSRLKIESTPYGPVLVTRARAPTKEEVSSSTSSVSQGRQQRAQEFLQDLKLQSIGAVEDADTDDFDSVPAGAPARSEISAVMRRQGSQNQNADETVVMTLSDDSDGENDLEPLDWEQQHSADDEHTLERPRRVRRVPSSNSKASSSKTGTPGHRRTRSGDGAAANLMTGGVDWKGMQQDMLPMPSIDDDDETETESKDAIPQIRQSSSGGSSSRPRNIKQARHPPTPVEMPIAGSPGGFSIGSTGSSNQRRARKPPRQRSMSNVFNGSQYTSPQPTTMRKGSLSSPRVPTQNQHQRSPSASSWDSRGSFPDGLWGDRQGAGVNARFGQGERSSERVQFVSQIHASGEGFDNRGSLAYHEHSQADIPQALPEVVGHIPRGYFQREASENSHISGLSRGSTFSWLSANEESMEAPETIEAELNRLSSAYNESDIEDESEIEARHISGNRMHFKGERLSKAEPLFESNDYRSTGQKVMRSRNGVGRRVSNAAMFKPVMAADTKDNPMFVCPQCGLKQRSFFTVNSAPAQLEGPASYLALYFGLYVISSLYIFGLQEGWKGLDCVYFAVITLTTAGLGDLVPTSDSAKIVCSIFIYFGVACIGLLLGTYLAGMMDERSQAMAMESRIDSCLNCSRVKMVKHREEKMLASMVRKRYNNGLRPNGRVSMSERSTCSTDAHEQLQQASNERAEKRRKHQHQHDGPPLSTQPGARGGPLFVETVYSMESPSAASDAQGRSDGTPSSLQVIDEYGSDPRETPGPSSPPRSFPSPSYNLGSPMTTQILGRQKHTRHQSIDVGRSSSFFSAAPPSAGRANTQSRGRISSEDAPTVSENNTLHSSFSRNIPYHHGHSSEFDDGDDVTETETASAGSEMAEIRNPDSKESKIKTAKYVFLTLKQALMNSIVIIAIGSMGFYFIERMSVVDSFYFTTVLLTTVGYGDIYPVTNGGKLFATIYVLVAGTVLLNNMSLISMIPLELRKRRIEKAVLTQFGDQLDDAALEELATGPLVQRLQLSSARQDGLAECTREMFALAMLVRLGKVTERDVRQTFAAFHRLDVDKEGILNSKTIITGLMHRRKSMKDFSAYQQQEPPAAPPPPPPPYNPTGNGTSNTYWFGDTGSLHVATESSTFRFPTAAQNGQRNLNGEHAALLGDRGQDRNSFAGGTFPGYDEEEGVQF